MVLGRLVITHKEWKWFLLQKNKNIPKLLIKSCTQCMQIDNNIVESTNLTIWMSVPQVQIYTLFHEIRLILKKIPTVNSRCHVRMHTSTMHAYLYIQRGTHQQKNSVTLYFGHCCHIAHKWKALECIFEHSRGCTHRKILLHCILDISVIYKIVGLMRMYVWVHFCANIIVFNKSLWYCLKSGMVVDSALFLFFITLDWLWSFARILYFFSYFCEECMVILIEATLNLHIYFGGMIIFTILMLPTHDHGNIFLSYHVSFSQHH